MYRFFPLFLLIFTLSAQTPSLTLDKPPQDVDDALRARIKTFYDYHVARKYRLAEQLMTEEAKDDFYAMSKPDLKAFKIGNIDYSDNFTKAKVVIVGSMPVLLPMAGGKIMDMPFASYWKIENGVWCWYYNKTALLHTPFGDLKPQDANSRNETASLPAPSNVSIESLQSAVKIERSQIDLGVGKPQTVKVANTLPGPVSLTIDCARMPLAQSGISATFDKKDLKARETAVLTLNADPRMKVGMEELLRITVSPTNQILDLKIKIVQ